MSHDDTLLTGSAPHENSAVSEQPAVRFEDVSKCFEFKADKPQSVLETIISVFSVSGGHESKTLWAARNVNFDVMPGESLGIVGRNGSGKSTILKLAAGIIRPTSGQVTVRGRLSALLELGAGFHHDLTGQENIMLNASILGMSKEDIADCYESIVEFSELGEYIQMPVKHYSSGMYMRLGFSVAVHVDPDVLIVDEILAVGDQSFKSKCLDRIYDLKHQGTTIIIVSHNLETVRTLCSHLIWIDSGEVQVAGPADEVIDLYLESQDGWYKQHRPQGANIFRRWGSQDIELLEVRLLDENGLEQEEFCVGDPMTVEMKYVAHKPVQEPEFGLSFYRRDGLYISGPDNQLAGLHMGIVEGSGVVRFHVEALPLLPAVYRLTAAIYDTAGEKPYDHHDKAYVFRMIDDGQRKRKGLFEMPARWEWIRNQEPSTVVESSFEVAS